MFSFFEMSTTQESFIYHLTKYEEANWQKDSFLKTSINKNYVELFSHKHFYILYKPFAKHKLIQILTKASLPQFKLHFNFVSIELVSFKLSVYFGMAKEKYLN